MSRPGPAQHGPPIRKRLIIIRHAQALHNYLLSKGRREEVRPPSACPPCHLFVIAFDAPALPPYPRPPPHPGPLTTVCLCVSSPGSKLP